MRSLYYSAEIKFKPRTSSVSKKQILEALELATEHPWNFTSSRECVSQSFDIASHLKPSIVCNIIKEHKPDLEFFKLSVYFIKEFPNKFVKLENNKLTFKK